MIIFRYCAYAVFFQFPFLHSPFIFKKTQLMYKSSSLKCELHDTKKNITGGKLPWCGPGLPRSSVNKPTNQGKQNTSLKVTFKHHINLISSSCSSSPSLSSSCFHSYFFLASCWQYFVRNSSIDGLCIVLSFPCLQLQILLRFRP